MIAYLIGKQNFTTGLTLVKSSGLNLTQLIQIILDEYFDLPREDRKREATVEELVRQERKERDKRRSGLDNDSSCKRQ
ncbi:MAG: hypothetical protein KAW56_17430 [Candidatus Marinimicrobia bacterium]|nr:hypothetical protein [Candidatus Neomarinimicrobiota bacterium]